MHSQDAEEFNTKFRSALFMFTLTREEHELELDDETAVRLGYIRDFADSAFAEHAPAYVRHRGTDRDLISHWDAKRK